MTRRAFVDLSMVLIGGTQRNAVRKGYARNLREAQDLAIGDPDFRLHPGALKAVIHASAAEVWMVGSRTPTNGLLWRDAVTAGFRIKAIPRIGGPEKEVDLELGFTILEQSEDLGEGDTVILVSGDRDFLPAVRRLNARGIAVEVLCWNHSVSHALVTEAQRFRSLDPYLEAIQYDRWAA